MKTYLLHSRVGAMMGAIVVAICGLLSYSAVAGPESPVLQVVAAVETEPMPNSGDAADDPAIWVHPTDHAQSTIIGTDKQGGIAVYDLTGRQLQYLPDGNLNNVDLRAGFPLGGEAVTLVTASNRSSDSIAIYRVNPTTRLLENVAARTVPTLTAYGACMYRSPVTGTYYYFGNSPAGEVEQWELFDASSGLVDARRVRTFDVGTQTEGCVADDELGHFYIGEEDVGIWKYGAEPGAGATRTLVDTTRARGRLAKDVEGLTIAYGARGTGYLIASSQGDNTFAVYERGGTNAYVAQFEITAGACIDRVSTTDGIDVTTRSLGPAFPRGVFVAQDNSNDGGNQNYKLVPLQLIADDLPAPFESSVTPFQGKPASAADTWKTYFPFISRSAILPAGC